MLSIRRTDLAINVMKIGAASLPTAYLLSLRAQACTKSSMHANAQGALYVPDALLGCSTWPVPCRWRAGLVPPVCYMY